MDIIPDIKKDNLSKQQIESLAEQEKELKYVGAMKVVPGHTMFQYNRQQSTIKKAEYTTEAILDVKGYVKYKKKLTIEPGCFYEQALNKKNFIKRLKKYGIVNEETAKELEATYVHNTRAQRDESDGMSWKVQRT